MNEPVIKKQEKEEKDELVILFPKHCKIEEWTYTKLVEDVLNIIVRTKKIEKKREKKEICLSKEEEELLKKLLKIKFEERSLKRVSEELTIVEICIVKNVLEKRLVSIY